MELSSDRTLASVDFEAKLTAYEVDELIGAMVMMREDMLPVVPLTFEDLVEDPQAKAGARDGCDPAMHVELRPTGGARLWLRTDGGWTAYDFSRERAIALSDLLRQVGGA